MISISHEDLFNAYRKLKHYFFLDTSALDLRYKIAEWEKDLDENIDRLYVDVQMFSELGESHFSKHSLEYYTFPKGFDKSVKTAGIFTNATSNAEVKSNFYYVDAPIEVHIIATLWCMKIGRDIENDHPKIDICYGNRLKLKDGHLSQTNQSLFEPFFVNYNKWRDTAITASLDSLNRGKDVVLLNLDISAFYDSVKIGPEVLDAFKFDCFHECHELTRLLMIFHCNYEIARSKNEVQIEYIEESYRLPIGLLSSGILANWYLKQFDQDVLNTRPIHYGRYVDDLLIAFEVSDIKAFQRNGRNAEDCINALLPDVFEKSNDGKLKIKSRENLSINPDKCSVFILNHNHPKSLLTLLLQDIKKNSSGFKFLPVEEDLNTDFENSTGSLLYREADSGKIRDVHGLIPAKFKITQYLARHIFFSHNLGHAPSLDTGKQMVSFFKGSRAIENYAQWERVLTYLYVNESETEFIKDFIKIIKHLKEAIETTVSAENDKRQLLSKDELKKVQDTLHKHLSHCLLLCRALNPQKWEKYFEKHMHCAELDFTILRHGGMVRHKYMPYPILSSTHYSTHDDCTNSMIDRDSLRSMSENQFQYDSSLKKNYPTYIHLHDLALKQFWEQIRSGNELTDKLYYPQDFNALATEFKDRNGFELKNVVSAKSIEIDDKIVKVHLDSDNQSTGNCDQLCIALANIKIEEDDLENSLCFFKKSKLDRKPFDQIFNQITDYNTQSSTKRKIDLVIFPELSMPYDYLYGLCKHVKKSGVGVVTGLTYIVLPDNHVLNVEAVILPIKVNGFQEAIPILRVKNYYAPNEKEMIESHTSKDGLFFKAAEPTKNHYYHLIRWRGVLFTVFNCFELTNIEHRSLFRGKIDCLIATEFNPDLSYFSSIVESTSRDLHCFVIQSNNAKYGDSRICAPYKKDHKDIIQIKGGKNPTILVEEIAISELREFQSTGFAKQKNHSKIKPTPAGFEPEISNSRFEKGK